MIKTYDVALSGIRAARTIMDVTARNVANANTDGFKKDRAVLSEGADGGVVVDIEKVTDRGPVRQTPDGKEVEASNVNLVEETGARITALRSLEANVAAFRTADEMERSLLDIFV